MPFIYLLRQETVGKIEMIYKFNDSLNR